jgi:hypothetical protein
VLSWQSITCRTQQAGNVTKFFVKPLTTSSSHRVFIPWLLAQSIWAHRRMILEAAAEHTARTVSGIVLKDRMSADMEVLKPSPALLCKLASIAVHADEMTGPNGHDFDRISLESALTDHEVVNWIAGMVSAGLGPVNRT